MSEAGTPTLLVTCPCCHATLRVDPGEGAVTDWNAAKDPRRTADLKDAAKLLADEKARVDARYQEIVKSDKEKGAAMDRKFKEFLEKRQDEPPEKPLRDIDLD